MVTRELLKKFIVVKDGKKEERRVGSVTPAEEGKVQLPILLCTENDWRERYAPFPVKKQGSIEERAHR